MADSFTIECPSCKSHVDVPRESSGREINCPVCGQRIMAPDIRNVALPAELVGGPPDREDEPALSRTPISPNERDARLWAMALHLSMLGNFVVPFSGLIAPIVIWQLKKDELPIIDAHGKNAVNWIISETIYAIVCIVLVFCVVGIPLLIGLGVLGVIFPIVAGIKANNGEVWKYPLTLTLIK